MFTTIRNAWKIKELRNKILFTLLIVLLYRIGNVIYVPFANVEAFTAIFQQSLSNTVLGLYNAMSGSAFSRATIFALSIQPYINASIIIQLLTIAIPPLERLSKEGEEGRKKLASITRYTTVGLGILMGVAYWVMLNSYGALYRADFFSAVVVVLSFAAGSAMVMWLGEQITERGIGNGISIILFANIISRIPSMVNTLYTNIAGDLSQWWTAVVVLVGMLALIGFIVFITQAERRIPVSYAKRVVGRKVYGGQNTHLPIKVNMSGVLPVIFAQSVATLPATFATFFGKTSGWWYNNAFSTTSAVYIVCYVLLIIAFSYFYATVQYNPVEIANNLRKNGGFIPGYRPGKPTSDFIARVINKITLFGAIYLGIVAVLPILAGILIPSVESLAIGGTSVIIVVGVALETVQAIEAQMLMRHYKGFLE